jgi:excisionase family DNA binding protein
MRYRFRIVRTQTAERTIRASDEDAAMEKLREELARPYGFFGRWEDAAMDVELLGAETSVEARGVGVDGGPLLLSVKDAAAHLGISRGLMYELLNRGEIESLRIGQRRLVSRDAINRFIETNSSS